MTLKPVIADNFDQNLAGFGGLASLAILVGLLPGVFLLDDQARQLGLWMLISSIPVFLGGSGEDIGLDIKPLQRLLASLVSAALAVVLFGYLVPYVATCLL
jgi:UDP-N-acetylmuramyl pentapeptide phosphotransferase/UDP-N-acetylglucosamine-1-phosphate transferase